MYLVTALNQVLDLKYFSSDVDDEANFHRGWGNSYLQLV